MGKQGKENPVEAQLNVGAQFNCAPTVETQLNYAPTVEMQFNCTQDRTE